MDPVNIPRREIICLLVFMLFAGIGAFWTHLGQALYRKEQRFYMTELIDGQASTIEQRLARSLSAARILAENVRQHRGLFDGFESFADIVMTSIDGVSSLQLAPNGIVRHIHPLAGNNKAIGHDILLDLRRKDKALQAVEELRFIMAGPFELIQGGIAVIGRAPIFLPTAAGEEFWGFASALIRLEDLLKATELDPQGRKGYSYQLSRVNPSTQKEEVFSRSTTTLTTDSYSIFIKVPDDTWKLIMSRSDPTPKWRSTTGYIASLLAGLMTAWIVYILLKQPDKLRRIVNEKTRELERLAYHDHLTELANRRNLSEQLGRVVKEYERYGRPAALMYLDLDDFKRVNDTMGHEAGDSLLRQVADRLNGCVRSSDLVARLGGDEFAILLLDPESIRDVSKIAEKLIHAIEQPVILESKAFVVSTSVGITMIPVDGTDVPSILSNADMAMYSAKKNGKRSFRFYDNSLQTEAVTKLQLEEDLSAAINQRQFVLHYQPIMDLSTGKLSGYEALIRWQHPERGLLYPDEFIAVAEETGKIVAVGYWVIEEACNQIKQFESEAKLRCRISVNLSPKQFREPELLVNIRDIVLSAGVDARFLEIEVTETSVMEDVEDAIKTLEQLKEMGITVAIDDFGTGYSSLALLKYLPVDRLKIDKSFIRDLATDRSDKKIVQALISMAHKLQLEVVAEGIETAKQLKLLQHYRCDYGQGYLFSKPVPVDNLPLILSGIRT